MSIPRYRLRVMKYEPSTGIFDGLHKGGYVKDTTAILEENPHKRGGWVKFESVKPLIIEVDKLRFDKQAALTTLARRTAINKDQNSHQQRPARSGREAHHMGREYG